MRLKYHKTLSVCFVDWQMLMLPILKMNLNQKIYAQLVSRSTLHVYISKKSIRYFQEMHFWEQSLFGVFDLITFYVAVT